LLRASKPVFHPRQKTIDAYQASQRGGRLRCEMQEDGRVNISGEAVLVAISDIVAELK